MNINFILYNIKKLKEKGFFSIVSSSILNKIFMFCGGILLVRVISKSDYGVYSYSNNLLSFFLLINGFGITEGLMQYGSKSSSKEEREKYIKYSIKIGLFSSLFLISLISLYSLYGIFKIEESRKIFFLSLGFPIINIFFSIVQIKLRIELRNHEMAIISNIDTFFNIFGMVIGGYMKGIIGVIIGRYIGNILSMLIYYLKIKDIFLNWTKIKSLSSKKQKEINRFSFIGMLTNSISQVLYIIDVFLIGLIIGNKNILASYKTATLIPFALNFIPLSLMVYLYPYFAKNSNNINWIKEKYMKMLKYFGVFNLFLTVFLVIFSKLIIKMVFGKTYDDSLNVFIILSIGYFFSATFRTPVGHIINSIGKIKFNFYNALISGIINIILDIILIKQYGSVGAAYATLLIFIISGLIGNIFLFYTLRSK